MLSKLQAAEKLVGANQVQKAIKNRRVKTVFVAKDADKKVTDPVLLLCNEKGVEVVTADTMKQLGEACGISVGASVAAIV